MNITLEDSPLTRPSKKMTDNMAKWVDAQKKGERIDVDIYGKPTEKQIQQLENVRNLSKELQDNLQEIENSVRLTDSESQVMHPTAPILDFSEDHEFVSANDISNYYSQEDMVDSKEAEKQRLTKDGRMSLKASRIVEKVVL